MKHPVLDSLIATALTQPRDSKVENRIVELLRSLNEVEALEYVQEMAVDGGIGGVGFAQRVLHKPDVIEEYFMFGRERCNASSIKSLLKFALPKLGLRRTIRILEHAKQTKSLLGEWALYWLPGLVDKKDSKLLIELSSGLRG